MADPAFQASALLHEAAPGSADPGTQNYTLLAGTNRILLFFVQTPEDIADDAIDSPFIDNDVSSGAPGQYNSHNESAGFFKYGGIQCDQICSGFSNNGSQGHRIAVFALLESDLSGLTNTSHPMDYEQLAAPTSRTIYIYQAQNVFQELPLYNFLATEDFIDATSIPIKMEAMQNNLLYVALTGTHSSGTNSDAISGPGGHTTRETQQTNDGTVDHSSILIEGSPAKGVNTLTYSSDGSAEPWHHVGIQLYPDTETIARLSMTKIHNFQLWKDDATTPDPWEETYNYQESTVEDGVFCLQVYLDQTRSSGSQTITPTFDGKAPSESGTFRGTASEDVWIQQFIWYGADLPTTNGNKTISVNLNGTANNGILSVFTLENINTTTGIESEYGGEGNASHVETVLNTNQHQNRIIIGVTGLGAAVGIGNLDAWAQDLYGDRQAASSESARVTMLIRNCDPTDSSITYRSDFVAAQDYAHSGIALVPNEAVIVEKNVLPADAQGSGGQGVAIAARGKQITGTDARGAGSQNVIVSAVRVIKEVLGANAQGSGGQNIIVAFKKVLKSVGTSDAQGSGGQNVLISFKQVLKNLGLAGAQGSGSQNVTISKRIKLVGGTDARGAGQESVTREAIIITKSKTGQKKVISAEFDN